MRFCLGTMDAFRATMVGFDCTSMADRTMQVLFERLRSSRNRILVARRSASCSYL